MVVPRLTPWLRTIFSPDRAFRAQIRSVTGFYPNNSRIFRLALTHRSAASTVNGGFRASNERLEFLGDAVVSAVVAKYLFQRFPFEEEGRLTELRSRIVSRKVLNELSREIGIPELVEQQLGGNRGNSSLPGDAYEALVGAIFLDLGYTAAEQFVLNSLQNGVDLELIIKEDSNFKSQIIEWCQQNKKSYRFEVFGEKSQGHDTIFTIHLLVDDKLAGAGTERSKKKAEQLAAKQALSTIIGWK